MINSTGGLLNLACGKGKTVMALAYSAYKQVPTIVIVHNTTLIDQWRDERIPEFLDVPGGVGTIQGPPDTWDWQGRGIVLAMVHSLALHRNSDQFLNGLSNYFGLVFFDEVHHLSAPLFVQTAPLFVGERHGLTATVNREDGLEPIYQYHIGEVYHRDLEQELTPEIYFLMNPLHLDRSSAAARHPETGIYDKNMKLNIPRLRNFLGRLPENNEFIAGRIRKPLEAGRKVLALSHSVEQLRILHEMFPGSGICTGRESAASRLQALRECNLTFGTLQLVKEGLDESALDTLFFLTPFGSSQVEDGGRNTLQQAMGRILRTRPDKKRPIVTILDHVYVDKFHRMCTNLKKQLDNWPTDQNGPLHYELMRPYSGDKQYG
jgi:superfamily II DNA or RNA helicase